MLGDEDGQTFCDWFDITEAGNFQGKNVPNLLKNPQFGQRGRDNRPLAEQLRVSRSGRGPLSRDEKVVTSWNAMAIGALAGGGPDSGAAGVPGRGGCGARNSWTPTWWTPMDSWSTAAGGSVWATTGC